MLKHVDHKDFEAINATVEESFDVIGTLHSYELNIPKIRIAIHIRRANGGGVSQLDPNAKQLGESDDLHPLSPKYKTLINGTVQVGLTA